MSDSLEYHASCSYNSNINLGLKKHEPQKHKKNMNNSVLPLGSEKDQQGKKVLEFRIQMMSEVV